MTFTRPTVGPKVYLSRGPSGHNETFLRLSADRELEQFLGSIKQRIAVEGFIRKMTLERRAEKWCDVIDYLAELTSTKADLVPLVVAISFWAQIDQTRAANERARLEAVGN